MNPLTIKPPKPVQGETVYDYVERAEEARLRIPEDVRKMPVVGFIATADGFKPWTHSRLIGTPTGGRENPAHVQTAEFDAAPLKKTSSQEKTERLVQLLLDTAEATYRATGRVEFSSSVLRRLSELTGMKELEIERMTMDALRGVYAQYAQWMLQRTERQLR